MTLKIFDKDGVQRDMDWMRREYGNITVQSAQGKRFKLIEIREHHNDTMLMVGVLNEQGAPHSGQPVAHWWPNPSTSMTVDLAADPNLKTVPHSRAAIARTDGSGWTGFGLGGGSFYDPAGAGPDEVWIVSPSLPSDIVRGLGWKAGTNHNGMMRLTFQIVDDEQTPEPEPTPTPNNDLDKLVALAAGLPSTWTPEKVATTAKARLAALAEVS